MTQEIHPRPARSLRRLITFLAAELDGVAADLGDDAATITVGQLLTGATQHDGQTAQEESAK